MSEDFNAGQRWVRGIRPDWLYGYSGQLSRRAIDEACAHSSKITCAQCPPKQAATAEQIQDARGWIDDCSWADDTSDLTDAQVIRGVERHYDGGWMQFIADGA